MTSNELLKQIMGKYFPEVKTEEILSLNKETRFSFILEQVNQLLTPENILSTPMAVSLANMFWCEDHVSEVTSPVKLNMPLNEQDEVAKLSDDERAVLSFVKETALICSDMLNHHSLEEEHIYDGEDVMEANGYTQWLFDFIKTTNLETLSKYAAYGLLRDIQDMMACGTDFAVAVDYMARPWSKQYGKYLNDPMNDDTPAKIYVLMVLEVLFNIREHIMNGREELGLCDKEIAIHDMFIGHFMTDFIPEVVEVSKEIMTYLENNVMISDEEYETLIDRTKTYRTIAHAQRIAHDSEAGKKLVKEKVEKFMEYLETERKKVDESIWKPYEPLSNEYFRYHANLDTRYVGREMMIELWH